MRHLLNAAAIRAEIKSCPDRHMAHLLASHVAFMNDNNYEGDLLTVVVIEPGDTLQTIDAEMEFKFLVNHYSGKRYGEPGFVPCFETLEEHPTFYEMFFIGGDRGLAVLIPKLLDVDRELLALCARHATPARDPSS